MADDKTTAQETEALADSSKQAERQLNRLGQSMSKTVNQASKLNTAVNKNERSYKALFKTIFKGTESLEDMEGAVKSTTDKFVEMALKGKQGALGMQVEMRKLAEATVGLAKKTEDAKGTISNLTSEYKDLQSGMRQIKDSIAKLNDQQRKGAISSAYYAKEISKLNAEQAELDNRAVSVEHSLKEQGSELYRLNRTMVEHHQRSINMINGMRASEREAMRLKGGLSLLKAEMLEYADGKLFSWLDRSKAIENLKKSVALLGEGYAKVADQYEINRRLDEQYGRTATFGIKGMGDAFMQAEGNAASFAATSYRLKMDIKDVAEIGGQIQARKLGIFGAKDANEANDNIRMLTDTVASFTRITGVDATTALDALQRRMESTGLSAKDANAELMDMYVTLRQMQGGIENDVVGLDDMVRLIEAASAASDSYVVDSRLMTQAMRAAANEAERLGGSRKLAMKSAEATGKFVGGGGEVSGKSSVATYMATRNLIKDMMVDPTPFLKGMNEQQKKYVEGIMAEVRSGEILEHQAAPLIEKAMGGTDEMTKRKFAELQRMYAKSGMKYSLMAEELGMEESEVRVMYSSMEDAIENQKRVQGYLDVYSKESEKLPLSEFMSKHYESVEDAIKGMKFAGESEEDIHKLKVEMLRNKFNISEKAATEYLKMGGPTAKNDIKTEAQKRQILSKAFDPSERAKETAQKLRDMRATTDPAKLKDTVTDALMKEYNISKDNVKAVEEVKKIAEDMVKGNDALEEPLKSLAATSSKEITTAESHLMASTAGNQILAEIRDKLPASWQTLLDHATGNGPLPDAAKTIGYTIATVLSLKFGPRFINTLYGILKTALPSREWLTVLKNLGGKSGGKGAGQIAATGGKGQVAKGAGMTGQVVDTTAVDLTKKGAGQIAATGGKEATESLAKKTTESLAKKGSAGAAKGAAKGLAKKVLGKLGAPIAIAVEGVSAYMNNQELDTRKDISEAEKSKRKWKNWIKAGGSAAGGILGGIAGSGLGPVGTFAGGVGGSMAGSAGAGWLADKFLGEDVEPGAATAAEKVGNEPSTMEQSKVPEYLKLIAANTGQYASYLKEEQRYRLLKGSLPTAGTFNDAASAGLNYKGSNQPAIRGAVDESRPSLGGAGKGPGEYEMDLDPSTYNESEDSVMVKFNNLTTLMAILKKKEATMKGT